ncbi:MAG TPA: SMI1/KNR4 family protein [Phototrophicaceae bacterium]|nr:SMI1/KNR4 family protein [Phototrophicaceae bacterium]
MTDMQINSIQDLKIALSTLKELYPPFAEKNFRGCTEEELEAVRIKQGVGYLPLLYQQFLLEMGNGGCYLYTGSEYTIADLLELKIRANTLLATANQKNLKSDVFVFLMHQGYAFMYFHTEDRNDNPPVYVYCNGREEPTEKRWKTLLEHYQQSLIELTEILKRDEK